MRADRIDGVGDKYVEAAGKVELRTRRETVLADWLRYDFAIDEIWGKGDVLLRRGIDWITGPGSEVQARHRDRLLHSPRFYVGENGARGNAAEIRFSGPTATRSPTRATRPASRRARTGTSGWTSSRSTRRRMVGTGHDATVHFFGAPVVYSPWFEFPLSNERKIGLPHADARLDRHARLRVRAVPYYLNLAPNYDATITPRLMTKRGLQLGGQFRYLFETAQGETRRGIPAARPRRPAPTATLSWRHTQNLDAIMPGLVGYLNLNKVSDDTYFSDLSDRVALTSQTTLPREGGFTWSHGPWQVLARAQAFQTLQDPGSPPVTPPYNRVPQVLGPLQETDWIGLTFAGIGEYAYFRQPTLTTGQRVYAWPTVAWSARARRGRSPRAPAPMRAVRPQRGGTTDVAARRLRDTDHVGRRRPRLRARLERVRHELRADARAARVLRLRPLPQPEQRADVRHRASTTSISASCSASTAISATTGSATPTS